MANAHKPIDQQVIVITGASSGIGLTTALLAADRGATVALVARSLDAIEEIAAEIQEAGGQAIAIEADVGDRKQVQAAADAVLAKFGRIDTWVNNAGTSVYGFLDEIDEVDARRLFDTNFWGIVNGSMVALPYLKETDGALVNLGSEVSEGYMPLQGMYVASKHAVMGFNDSLRVELEHIESSKVTVTLIQPTAVNTPFPERARNLMDREPKLPKPQVEPEEVAEAILGAAEKGGLHIKVGLPATINTAVAKLLPAVFDRIAAKQVGTQQKDIPARNPEGALHQPSEPTGRTHGLPG